MISHSVLLANAKMPRIQQGISAQDGSRMTWYTIRLHPGSDPALTPCKMTWRRLFSLDALRDMGPA
jgi:hypothetical protein